MEKIYNAVKFYTLTNILKSIVRNEKENGECLSRRSESIAEHVYGTQMLALAMHSEFQCDIDIKKVIFMLAVHELEEAFISDLNSLGISEGDKAVQSYAAVEQILSELLRGEDIKRLILEYKFSVTSEAKFARCCDKLEHDFHCGSYKNTSIGDLDLSECINCNPDQMRVRFEKMLEFYKITNKLKGVLRTGWLNWHVNADRIESVAEHVYGVQMLALAMQSEFQYDIDIEKVIFMLAVHELEETVIGDLTYLDISAEDKKVRGHAAVEKILAGLLSGDQIKQLIFEFDNKATPEARFAYCCDKMECDLQCKLYDEAGYVDPYDQGNSVDHDPNLMNKLKAGQITWSYSWLSIDRDKYIGDARFLSLLDYIRDNAISESRNVWMRKLINVSDGTNGSN